MGSIPAHLEVWPVTDSRSGNKVAWAYDSATQIVYVVFRQAATYSYSPITSELVDRVRSSGYVSQAITDEILPRNSRRIG